MRTTKPGPTHIAVVGYGYWGSKHVRVLSSIPDVEVTLVDWDHKRLAEASAHYPAVRLAQSLDDVLDDVDAVLVASTPATHASLALAALVAGKHTFVEKPMTTSVADGEMLVELAQRHGVQLMVGHTFVYNPAVWKLKQIIQSGMLGRILYIDASRLSLGRYQRDIDVIWDLAPHDISIISYLLDETPVADGVWAHHHIGLPQADVAHLRLGLPVARIHAFVHVSWLSPNKVRKVTVVGEQMMATYDDMSDDRRIMIYDAGVNPAEIDDAADVHSMPVSYRTGDIVSPFIPFTEPLLIQDQHFVDCVREGVPCRTPGQRGLDVVRVLAAADAQRVSAHPSADLSIAAPQAGL